MHRRLDLGAIAERQALDRTNKAVALEHKRVVVWQDAIAIISQTDIIEVLCRAGVRLSAVTGVGLDRALVVTT